MAETKIEWAHYTFNPWRGCTKVSDGCKHCYADTMSVRNHDVLGIWGINGTRPIAAESYWKLPLKWDLEAKAAGERRRVFCGSLMDIFEGNDSMPVEAWESVAKARRRLFLEIIPHTPNLDWLLLTKRPENIEPILWQALDPDHEDNDFNACGDPHGLSLWPFNKLYPNVWLGTSVEDQKTVDERIPHLLKAPAAVRFLSIEPLLDCVDISLWLGDLGGQRSGVIKGIDWVIVGGESGANARPMHPDWVRSIRDQCEAPEVPFLFKQWGEWVPGIATERKNPWNIARLQNGLTTDLLLKRERTFYNPFLFSERVGKNKAGRLLDGREWNEFPEVGR